MVLLDMGIYVFCLLFFKGFYFKKFSLRIILINIMIRFLFGVFFCVEMGGGCFCLCRIYKVIIIFKRKMGDWWYIVDVEIILYNKFDN